MPRLSPATPACRGTVYVRRASAWIRGELRVDRTALRFVCPQKAFELVVRWGDVVGARVLSTIAAGFEPGCFDVAVTPGAAEACSHVGPHVIPRYAAGPDVPIGGSQRRERFAGSAGTLRFMTGDLSIAADWVGEIDDAVAAAEEGSLARWWQGASSRAPLQLDYTTAGNAASLPTSCASSLTTAPSAVPSANTSRTAFPTTARPVSPAMSPIVSPGVSPGVSRSGSPQPLALSPAPPLPLTKPLEADLVARYRRTVLSPGRPRKAVVA